MRHKRYGNLAAIASKTDGNCHICHKPAPIRNFGSPARLGGFATTIDHLVCQSFGGSDHPSNLLLAHARCNSSRGTRSIDEARLQWAGTKGKPWSTQAKYATAGAVALGLGLAAGNYFAHRDQRGQQEFNWRAAGRTAVGCFGLFCLLRAIL